ncbi:response regulator [Thermoleophilia bacterium SCSIO 60948]|nr:response regulator [Thermoleophilia bacterium SCSIO 60948]
MSSDFASATSASQNASDESQLILIAEDEPDIRELATLVLERAGYRTIAFSDGASALEGARNKAPDLCLLDVMMPRMNGFEVLSAIKSDAELSGVKTIICTATIQDERDVREGGPGADAYIRKPFSTAELQGTVDELLG